MSVKIVKKLSIWFEKNARDLPWRKTPDPYRVWLSEVMLQQTRVATVIPYFERFLQEFPAIGDLARADEERVFRLWAGLGYYSRARNLHRGAKAIAARLERNEGFPANRAEWLAIPGVGEYTAGAVCSIALGQREPIVDGNVVRVLSRLHSIATLDSKKTEIWNLARSLVETKNADPRVLNQALMELGAVVCTPKSPKCEACPVASECTGKSAPQAFPAPKAKKEWKHLRETRMVLVRSGDRGLEVLLQKNGAGAWREGLWDFPATLAPDETGLALLSEFDLSYVVTRHKVERTHRVFRCSRRTNEDKLRNAWFEVANPPGVPAPVRKALARLALLPQFEGSTSSARKSAKSSREFKHGTYVKRSPPDSKNSSR